MDNVRLKLSVSQVEALIAFIKMHERDEIPDEVWDVCMYLYDVLEEV